MEAFSFSPELAETPSWAMCPYVVTMTSREGWVRVSPLLNRYLALATPRAHTSCLPNLFPGCVGIFSNLQKALAGPGPRALLVEPPLVLQWTGFLFRVPPLPAPRWEGRGWCRLWAGLLCVHSTPALLEQSEPGLRAGYILLCYRM